MPSVYYVNPGRPDKNIGRAYNEICSLFPDDSWICISDQDCLWWPELVLKQIGEILNRDSSYSLLGCMTNRLASEYQRPFPGDFDNMNIRDHRARAEELYNKNYGIVEGERRPIAGLFMLFPKKVWNRIKFKEQCISADTKFCKDILRSGGKIGLMKGVYCFHWYRGNAVNPASYKKHLLA